MPHSKVIKAVDIHCRRRFPFSILLLFVPLFLVLHIVFFLVILLGAPSCSEESSPRNKHVRDGAPEIWGPGAIEGTGDEGTQKVFLG